MLRIGDVMPSRIMVGSEEVKAVYIGDVLIWPESIVPDWDGLYRVMNTTIAQSIVGSEWKIPSLREVEDLWNNTTHTWEDNQGVKGMRFTSKKNSNSIFIPAVGRHLIKKETIEVEEAGTNAWLWLNDLYGGQHLFLAFYAKKYYIEPYYGYSSTEVPAQSVRLVSSTRGVDLGVSVRWASSNLSINGFVGDEKRFGDLFLDK